MRYDAIGRPLPADKGVAALLKPVRQFMRIETDSPSQSKGWKSAACRHLVDMLRCDLKQFRSVPRA